MLHEEMYDIESDNGFGVSGQELYQLWLNVPADNKLDDPFVQLLGGEEETPLIVDKSNEAETLVLAGSYEGQASSAKLYSDVSIFHVKIGKTDGSTSGSDPKRWTYSLPASHATALLYLRTGSVIVDGEDISAHNTVYFESTGENLVVESSEGADFMFLSGAPLYEPVAAQGSMVMNSANGINQAYTDYQSGKMGSPWDHTISDEEWKTHVNRFPSIYK